MEKTNPTELFQKYSYSILAGLSTISLITSSYYAIKTSRSINQASESLLSISKWAEAQNDCIDKSFKVNGKDTLGLSSKVWSCNGGGD